MNIFFLDRDPKLAAQYHTDKHVVKMISESAQMLSTVLFEHYPHIKMFKPTHVNHPCNKWLRESKENMLWLLDLTEHLNDEYIERYSKLVNHASYDMLANNNITSLILNSDIPSIGLTPPALAMPDYCKIYDDPVACYRLFYKMEKTHLFAWKSHKPYWI